MRCDAPSTPACARCSCASRNRRAPDLRWFDVLRSAIQRSVEACEVAGAELFVNDHWRLARELGARGVHLGQEDLLALGEAGRAGFAASGLALGISSHSLWELCRARSSAPRYIACGPVWPTLTKAMPWRPQGLPNLRWWQAMAQAPVVAIGGVLQPAQVRAAAACGVDGVCVVRALGDTPMTTVPALQQALLAGRMDLANDVCSMPLPSLDAAHLSLMGGWRLCPYKPEPPNKPPTLPPFGRRAGGGAGVRPPRFCGPLGVCPDEAWPHAPFA